MNIEIARFNGEFYACIPVQNDWTGNYKNNIRKVRLDGNNYVCTIEGIKYDVSSQVRDFKMYEDRIEMWRKWYKDTHR